MYTLRNVYDSHCPANHNAHSQCIVNTFVKAGMNSILVYTYIYLYTYIYIY